MDAAIAAAAAAALGRPGTLGRWVERALSSQKAPGAFLGVPSSSILNGIRIFLESQGKRIRCLERTTVEKNGESTPRRILSLEPLAQNPGR